MLNRNLIKSLDLQGYTGFNKMVADKLSFFKINGKLSLSLALLHGMATGWYLLTPNKDSFREHHGLNHQHRGLMRSLKANLVTTCPIDCSVNTAVLVTAGFMLEQKLGSLFLAKSLFLLTFSSIAAQHIRITGERKQENPTVKQKYKFYGMHNISAGLLILLVFKSITRTSLVFYLSSGLLLADIFAARGFQSVGYLPAIFMGLLI